MKKILLKNTVTSLLMQMTTVICGFVLPRLFLEVYGSEVNGLIQSITQFLGLITFLELGVGQVVQSSLYEPLVHGNTGQISKIIKSGTVFFRKIAYVFLAYIAILVVAFPFITDQQFERSYSAVLIGAISFGTFAQYYFGLIDRILLSADQRGYVTYTVQIVTTILNAVTTIFMVRSGFSIQAVKLTSSAVFLVNPLVIRWYINTHYQIDRKSEYKGEPIKQKWNAVAQHVSAVVLEGTDIVVLTLFSSLSNVSVYSVYYMVISGVKQFYTAATAGMQSMIGSLWAKRDNEKLLRIFSLAEVVLHFAVVFLFSCIGVLIVPFVTVYTNGLTDVNYVQPTFALILTLAYAVRCLRTPYNIMILAAGHYKQTQRCHVITALLNVVFSVALVLLWGLIGIALGTLISIAYQTVWMMVYVSKNLLKWPLRKSLKQIAIDILTVVLIFIFTKWIDLSAISYWGWFNMAVPVALIAVAVTVLMALLFYNSQLIIAFRAAKRR